jgi:hypothetical protein
MGLDNIRVKGSQSCTVFPNNNWQKCREAGWMLDLENPWSWADNRVPLKALKQFVISRFIVFYPILDGVIMPIAIRRYDIYICNYGGESVEGVFRTKLIT